MQMTTSSVDDVWSRLKAQSAPKAANKAVVEGKKPASAADEQFNKLWLSLNGVGKRPAEKGARTVELEVDHLFKATPKQSPGLGRPQAEVSGAAGSRREGGQSSDASEGAGADSKQLTAEEVDHALQRGIAALKDPASAVRRRALQDIQVS